VRPLDAATIRAVIHEAADTVTGDWIVLGGTVLPLLEAGYRTTLDIDLIPLGDAPQSQILILMGIAERHGLPVETINQAAGYFLRRVPRYLEHTVLLHEGSRARIYRPDPTLFVLLKLPRLSQSDLEDCLAFLRLARDTAEKMEEQVLRDAVVAELEAAGQEGRRERLERLLTAL
jgi:hypothetical protein